MPVILSDMGIVCALGRGKKTVWEQAAAGSGAGLRTAWGVAGENPVLWGEVDGPLPAIGDPEYDHRCNALSALAAEEIREGIEAAVARYGRSRIGIVAGSSNTGIREAFEAVGKTLQTGRCSPDFHVSQLELGSPAAFLKKHLGLGGPAYTVSTACSSSAKVFVSARALIENDVCDAVIAGGTDSLCALVANGFHALSALSADRAQPFSRNRKGINLGEGAAFFIVERGSEGIALLGAGESSDAYHMTSPDPTGEGAKAAMLAALADAALEPAQIDCVNLHGTGTPHNDLMEGAAVAAVFPESTWCVSTKPLTGHTLGAAGAVELALSWLMLSGFNPGHALTPHVYDGAYDPEIPPLRLIPPGAKGKIRRVLSNSFAFGGSNASVIIGRL